MIVTGGYGLTEHGAIVAGGYGRDRNAPGQGDTRLKPYRTWRERIGSSEDEPIRAIERRRREEEEIILL